MRSVPMTGASMSLSRTRTAGARCKWRKVRLGGGYRHGKFGWSGCGWAQGRGVGKPAPAAAPEQAGTPRGRR